MPHKYAPARLVRLVNDPLYRALIWSFDRGIDDRVHRYDGNAQMTVWHLKPEESDDEYTVGKLAGFLSAFPLLCYLLVIALVSANGSGTLESALVVIAALAAIVSLNDCFNFDVEYQTADAAELIGRARTEEVSGA